VRLVFLGTSSFAVPALTALAEAHDVVLVITQPDRPAGRKREPRASAVKEAAIHLNLPLAQPERINNPDGIGLLHDAAPDAIVVASYGQFLSERVFALPPLGTINIHASLLPRLRGAAPINWAIIRGDTETGVTTFLIDKGMDTGMVLLKRECAIGPDETAGELHDRLAKLGAEAIVDTLCGLADRSLQPTPQCEEDATLAPTLSCADGTINWSATAREVHNLVRGANPWPGAFTHCDERLIKLHRTALSGVGRGDLSPGAIAVPETGRLLVATRDELLEILEIQRECRPRTNGSAFLNGLRGVTSFS